MTRCPRCQRRLPPTNECAVHGRPSVLASSVDGELPDPIAPEGYTLGRLRAIGGTAIVYAVTSTSGVPAVLKWGRWRDREMHARFEREAAILRELGAPWTPTLLARGTHDRCPYLLMEDVPGETLALWMARAGDRGGLGEIVSLLLRLARVLHDLHTRGYVHCDLKPENVVIGATDVRLLDFGLAAREGDTTTPAGTVVGTVHYLAPEQLRTGAAIDRRADIYAFGVIAYEMIVGQPPFVGERRAIEYQHQIVRPSPLRDLRHVPAEIDDFVLACLAKQPESRPQTAAALVETLTHASAYIQTLKGVGHEPRPRMALGARDKVVLAWIEGGDPITVARAINDVHGIIVRSRPGALLAAFAAQFHDAPVAVALATCRELAHGRCRIVIHVTSALVRRSAHGKPAFYGPEIEQPASWAPSIVFTGLVLTPAAAELASTLVVPASDVGGFFRAAKRDRTDSTDVNSDVRLVGRDRILQEVGAIAGGGGMLIGIFGAEGSGKSRLLGALVERLRASKREVLAIRGRRRLFGDRPDDDRLLDALGGGDDLAQALANAASRRMIVVIDDVHWFSRSARDQLLRADLLTSRVIASREPMFEVARGVTKRLAIELPPLSFTDAEQLLRDLLQPARLIPDVLVQRLTVRAGGNPGLLVALARDIKHRGGIRCHQGSDDWYVAADEVDTLNAAPSAAWLAARGLEGLAVEVAPLVRLGSALGPKFNAEELAAVTELPSVAERLLRLVRDEVFAEKHGWFEFVDPNLQEAIYDHALDERTLVHTRALRYWLAHRSADLVGWLARVAHHAAGCGDVATATACWGTLARETRKRGELELASEIEQRVLETLMSVAPSALADAVRALDE
jgi:tRNA A-37 threonylcarbamoyl transferase component Bud32